MKRGELSFLFASTPPFLGFISSANHKELKELYCWSFSLISRLLSCLLRVSVCLLPPSLGGAVRWDYPVRLSTNLKLLPGQSISLPLRVKRRLLLSAHVYSVVNPSCSEPLRCSNPGESSSELSLSATLPVHLAQSVLCSFLSSSLLVLSAGILSFSLSFIHSFIY